MAGTAPLQHEKCVDIVALAMPMARNFRPTAGFDVWSLNNYFNYLHKSVVPHKVFQIHLLHHRATEVALLPRMQAEEEFLARHYNEHPYLKVLLMPGHHAPELYKNHEIMDTAFMKHPRYTQGNSGGKETYFGSTMSYMVAYAVHLGYTHIRVWACPLAGLEEYFYQRPSMMSLLRCLRNEFGEKLRLELDYEMAWEMNPLPATFPRLCKEYIHCSAKDIEGQKKIIQLWAKKTPQNLLAGCIGSIIAQHAPEFQVKVWEMNREEREIETERLVNMLLMLLKEKGLIANQDKCPVESPSPPTPNPAS